MKPQLSGELPEPSDNESSPRVDVDFRVFAPVVFSSLRAALGLRHDDFLESISPPEECFRYLELVTNSKSNSAFFLSYDRRFILKVESKATIKRFMRLLESV